MTDLRPLRIAAGFMCSLALAPPPAEAEAPLSPVPYTDLELMLDAAIRFETLPRRSEPGITLDSPVRAGLAWLGERLGGQFVHNNMQHDSLSGTPHTPLSVVAGAPGASLSVAYHRGFGSTALFPLGPAGFPALNARGEGAVAILFDHDQPALGLRVHSDYAAPLGQARPQGYVTLTFYTREGHLITRYRQQLNTAVTELGFARAGHTPDIAAVTITNDDPGGIALDDILYQTAPAAF